MYKGLLFTGDMHLRPDVPVCRTDDFLVAQWGKFQYIQEYAEKNQLAWIDAGDVFHKAVLPLVFVNEVLRKMDINIRAGIMGNHDLPAHNIGRVWESAWGALRAAGFIESTLGAEPTYVDMEKMLGVDIYGVNYGEEIPEPYENNIKEINVLVMHDMVYASRKDIIPNAPGGLAKRILQDNPKYDIIVTGHNHQSFMVEIHGRYLVNVGSMTRQTADQADHIPKFAVWTPDAGLEWVMLEYPVDVVSREHIDKKEQKEEELNAFVVTLQDTDQVSLSFEDNVETVIQETKPDKPVENKVREAME